MDSFFQESLHSILGGLDKYIYWLKKCLQILAFKEAKSSFRGSPTNLSVMDF